MMFEKAPPFKLEEAYFQKWVAGIKEGGSGINIHLNFSTLEPHVIIQDIYFRNCILEAKGSLETPERYVAYLSNNSKIDTVMDRDPIKETKNTPSQDFPFALGNNEAVVSYWFGGKKNFYKIPNLVEKKQIAYPQSGPDNK